MPTTTVDLTADDPRGAAARRTAAWITAGLATAAVLAGGLLAPADAAQGQAQRLMYVHVPAAWVAYLAFAVVLGASVAYLVGGDVRWDRVARAGAEIGVALTAVAIGTGSLWGHLVWGAWWAWDPRLVSTALLLLAYAGYLALRRALAERTDDDRRVARPAAVAGITGFLLVPVVHFSVLWWRSLHQQATILAPERPPIDPRMALALLLAVAAASTGALLVLAHRVRRLARVAATPEPATAARRSRAAVG